MANRDFTKNHRSMEKEVVDLFARVTFGAAGAPTLDAAKSKGVKSVSRTSAGLFVITLQDSYQRLFSYSLVFKNATPPAAPFHLLITDASATNAAPAITVKFFAVDNATATDPASGEEVRIVFRLSNSTAL